MTRKLRVVSDIQALDSHADLPDLVWHFLDGRGGGLSLLNAMKIAQGEAQPSWNDLGAEMWEMCRFLQVCAFHFVCINDQVVGGLLMSVYSIVCVF